MKIKAKLDNGECLVIENNIQTNFIDWVNAMISDKKEKVKWIFVSKDLVLRIDKIVYFQEIK